MHSMLRDVAASATKEDIAEELLSLEETYKEPGFNDHVDQGMADDDRSQAALAYDISNSEGDAKQKGQTL